MINVFYLKPYNLYDTIVLIPPCVTTTGYLMKQNIVHIGDCVG